MSIRRDIVKQALADNPKMPTRTISRMLYKEHPEHFNSQDHCRGLLRYHRKELHQKPGKIATNPISMRTKAEKKQAMAWAKLPESYASEYTDFVLPKACNKILLLSDIHLPYHDLRALERALQYGKDKKANCIFLNGDTLDMYMISRFVKDPGMVDLGTELETLHDFLKLLKDEFKCPVYFKLGNHEERWETYLKIKAPELLSVTDFRLDVLCKFGELGVVEIKDKRVVKAGELAILHGHEFARSAFSPVNAARGLFLRAKRSAIIGHHHQTSEHSEKDISGKVTTCWSQGCLSELNPQYMPLNKWNHGFAFVKVKKDKTFEVKNLRILDGRIV